MSEIKTSFEYILSSPIKYSGDGGEFIESDLLVLYAPSMKEMRFAAKLKQHFYSALEANQQSISESSTKDSSSKTDDQQIDAQMLMLLLEKGGNNLEEVYACFSLLLQTKVCKIDDKVEMKKSILEGIPFVEIEQILGMYLDHFLLQSFKKLIGQSSSKT